MAMSSVKTRLEALEKQTRPSGMVDLAARPDVQFEVLRAVLALREEGRITEQEAADMLRHETAFPYPISREGDCSLVPYLRVLIGARLVWLRWFGWPGTCPDGYQHVAAPVRPDGTWGRAGDDKPTRHRDPRWPIQWGTYRHRDVQP